MGESMFGDVRSVPLTAETAEPNALFRDTNERFRTSERFDVISFEIMGLIPKTFSRTLRGKNREQQILTLPNVFGLSPNVRTANIEATRGA